MDVSDQVGHKPNCTVTKYKIKRDMYTNYAEKIFCGTFFSNFLVFKDERLTRACGNILYVPEIHIEWQNKNKYCLNQYFAFILVRLASVLVFSFS